MLHTGITESTVSTGTTRVTGSTRTTEQLEPLVQIYCYDVQLLQLELWKQLEKKFAQSEEVSSVKVLKQVILDFN